jgi:phosphoglycolate phosphatase-like HAD superfamily hydrolase
MTAPPGIVFDFDGVIVESLDIKTQAFRTLFQDQPAHVDAIVAFHCAQAGMSRFDKFDLIFRDILKRPLAPATRASLGVRFATLVRQAVEACPEVPGATACLSAHSAAGRPLFVASATPEPELRQIVETRGLARYFQGVYGSPRTKAAIARQILETHGGRPTDWWFVGDAVNDWRAAQAAGMTFVGRVRAGDADEFPADIRRIRDLTDLLPDAVRPHA